MIPTASGRGIKRMSTGDLCITFDMHSLVVWHISLSYFYCRASPRCLRHNRLSITHHPIIAVLPEELAGRSLWRSDSWWWSPPLSHYTEEPIGPGNGHSSYLYQSQEISTDIAAQPLGRPPSTGYQRLNQISHGDIWQEKQDGTTKP